jgi:hypothetical protein
VKIFKCGNCNNEVHFDNHVCVNCGASLGYSPETFEMLAFTEQMPAGRIRCSNADAASCNWLVDADEGHAFCAACRLNLMVPNLSNPEHAERWRRLESAKRQFLYGLMRLGLPIVSREEDPEEGLAFELLADQPGDDSGAVMTGHDNGLITINIAEGSDPEREARREALGEPLRTMIGHFRHESGHYYWNLLVRDHGKIPEARPIFGDESEDYAEALQRYYANGPAPAWQDHFISAYASSHPWEDFAESWAHYLHIVDGLETAQSYGLKSTTAAMPYDPYDASQPVKELAEAWVSLSIAVNAVNRSIGQPDLYPFVFSEDVIAKLGFIHHLVHPQA